MARRRLTPEAQLAGVRKALRTPKTPKQLRPALRRRAEHLERLLGRQAAREGTAS